MTARPHRAPPLSVPEAAGQLGISRAQVYRYIDSGVLAAIRCPKGNGEPGGPIKVKQADIDAFIAKYHQAAS